MSLLYSFALAGVALAILATLIATVVGISVKANWQPPRFGQPGSAGPLLQPVEVVERRHEQLPFVGADRREADAAAEALRRAA